MRIYEYKSYFNSVRMEVNKQHGVKRHSSAIYVSVSRIHTALFCFVSESTYSYFKDTMLRRPTDSYLPCSVISSPAFSAPF